MCLAVPGRILSIASSAPVFSGGVSGSGGVSCSPADQSAIGDELDLWRTAEVDFGGVRQQVSLACLPEARVGDQVLVHVGFALSVVDDAEETSP
jgi:hydrogenase expression/formation protein HypC